jgi:hypothetical protein
MSQRRGQGLKRSALHASFRLVGRKVKPGRPDVAQVCGPKSRGLLAHARTGRSCAGLRRPLSRPIAEPGIAQGGDGADGADGADGIRGEGSRQREARASRARESRPKKEDEGCFVLRRISLSRNHWLGGGCAPGPCC